MSTRAEGLFSPAAFSPDAATSPALGVPSIPAIPVVPTVSTVSTSRMSQAKA